jgi:TonB family protein
MMRKQNILRKCSTLLLACIVLGAFAAPLSAKTSPTKHTAVNADPIKVLVGSIFLNSVDSSANLYRGCNQADFKSLAWGLKGVESKISISKSEYETDAEFQARKQKAESIINAGRKIIVCQPLDDNEDTPFDYDADKGVFKGSFNFHQNVWRDTKRLGKYVSHTRMGIRATVTSSLDIEYDLDLGESLREVSNGCLSADYLSAKYEVPVPRAEAPALKASGYLVFLGRLSYPFFDTSDSPGSPTLDDPRDIYERDMTVHFALEELAVVGPNAVAWKCVIEQNLPPSKDGPRPKFGSLASVFSADDYPLEAQAAGQQGTVRFRLTVGADGRVSDCVVIQSSGSAALDERTCTILRTRATFIPAADESGQARESTYENTVSWHMGDVLPQQPQKDP